MSNYPLKIRTYIFAIVAAIALTTAPLRADIICGTFDGPNQDLGSFGSPAFTVVQTIDFDVADVNDVTFEANFFVIDAGIRITVNGMELFETPADVTQFGQPGIFSSNPANDSTGAAFDNLGFAFNPLADGSPRLTVNSDSTGTSFSGNNQVGQGPGPITPVAFTPSFLVANFSDLLTANDTNTIVIENINDNGRALLVGDFTVVAPATTAVPEPSAVSLCLLGGLLWIKRRRRQ